MSTETNKELVTTFMRLLCDGHVRSACACLAEDIQWKMMSTSQPATLAKEQIVSGIEARIAESADGKFRIWALGMTAEDDRIAVEAESLIKLKGGKTYNNKYHYLWIIRGGFVVEAREYSDTQHRAVVLSAG
jgi:ketosteroid isomerase-like protein